MCARRIRRCVSDSHGHAYVCPQGSTEGHVGSLRAWARRVRWGWRRTSMRALLYLGQPGPIGSQASASSPSLWCGVGGRRM
eukprot:42588-Eustigmatos_ZCMA.PRE.1